MPIFKFIVSCHELIRNRRIWQNQRYQKLTTLRVKEKNDSKIGKKQHQTEKTCLVLPCFIGYHHRIGHCIGQA